MVVSRLSCGLHKDRLWTLFQYLVLPISPADVVYPKVASYLIVFIHFSLIFPHLGLYEKTVPTFGHTMYTCEKKKSLMAAGTLKTSWSIMFQSYSFRFLPKQSPMDLLRWGGETLVLGWALPGICKPLQFGISLQSRIYLQSRISLQSRTSLQSRISVSRISHHTAIGYLTTPRMTVQ